MKNSSKDTVPVCLVCGDPFGKLPLVSCKRCDTCCHKECWDFNGKCAVFGCNGFLSKTICNVINDDVAIKILDQVQGTPVSQPVQNEMEDFRCGVRAIVSFCVATFFVRLVEFIYPGFLLLYLGSFLVGGFFGFIDRGSVKNAVFCGSILTSLIVFYSFLFFKFFNFNIMI